jgi:hypothetical protein
VRPVKADAYLICLALSMAVFGLLMVHAALGGKRHMHVIRENAAMVEALGLTDLCMFTEARYTRHPAVADLNTAFQDHPASLEHFPSGSLIGPPGHLRKWSGHGLD